MLIQTIDPGRSLQRRYRLQQLPPTVLAPEVVPVVVVDDLVSDNFDKPDNRSCIGHADQPAGGAGLFSAIVVLGSPGFDAILERAHVIVGNGASSGILAMRYAFGGIVGLTPAGTAFRDRRLLGVPSTFVQRIATLDPLVSNQLVARWHVQNNRDIDLGGIYLPAFRAEDPDGMSVAYFQLSTANVALGMTIWFRELQRGG